MLMEIGTGDILFNKFHVFVMLSSYTSSSSINMTLYNRKT